LIHRKQARRQPGRILENIQAPSPASPSFEARLVVSTIVRPFMAAIAA